MWLALLGAQSDVGTRHRLQRPPPRVNCRHALPQTVTITRWLLAAYTVVSNCFTHHSVTILRRQSRPLTHLFQDTSTPSILTVRYPRRWRSTSTCFFPPSFSAARGWRPRSTMTGCLSSFTDITASMYDSSIAATLALLRTIYIPILTFLTPSLLNLPAYYTHRSGPPTDTDMTDD